MRFKSPKELLGYYYAARRGPGWSTPSYSDAPSGYRDRMAWIEVGALIRGTDGLDVPSGTHMDRMLERWAADQLDRTPKEVARLVRKLRRLMREHGYSTSATSKTVLRFTDDSGRTYFFGRERDKWRNGDE